MTLTPGELPAPLGIARSFVATLEKVSRLAPLDRPLLVVGERGTGKELIAARLHFLSRRWERPFIKVNCAALAPDLLESELFGHEAGAFTGAARRHHGRFERADGGTLFLDEIADASLRVQEKILRAVEYGEFERVGSATTLQVDVRVIGATNVDLPSRALSGQFRADLLDRLAFDVITLPPLRARPEDILLLADHFGRGMARELGWASFPGLSQAAQQQLTTHRWPGNVRELRNVVERAVAGARSSDRPVPPGPLDPFDSPYRPSAQAPQIDRTDAPNEPAPVESAATGSGSPEARPGMSEEHQGFKERVKACEIDLLQTAMSRARYNQQQAARNLGLSYHQLRGLLRKHGLLPRASGQPL